MPVSQAQQDFVTFMVDYSGFLERMIGDEDEKLESLKSRDLSRIEHSITISQANAKQLENYETKRISIQQKAGWGGLSFRELISKAPLEEQGSLQQVFARFQQDVQEIRFRNDKSMAVARDNMMEFSPESVLPGQGGQKPANPYEKAREEQNEQNKILQGQA